MSVSPSYAHPAPVGPHGRAGPRRDGPRAHAVVALCVIASLGTIGAFCALFAGMAVVESCHEPGDLGCDYRWAALVAFSSIPAVLAGVALSVAGIVRAGRGGGHGPAVAAWCVWVGFCVAWWVLFGAVTS